VDLIRAWHHAPVASTAKKIVVVLLVVLFAVLLYFAYVYRNLRVQSAAADRARADLEVGYRARLAEYERALPIGTPRSEVLKYLDSRKILHSNWRGDINVELGREPDVFPCDYWSVYLSSEFGLVPRECGVVASRRSDRDFSKENRALPVTSSPAKRGQFNVKRITESAVHQGKIEQRSYESASIARLAAGLKPCPCGSYPVTWSLA
jgi:hypothetical protein